jgi:hypothetical protein
MPSPDDRGTAASASSGHESTESRMIRPSKALRLHHCFARGHPFPGKPRENRIAIAIAGSAPVEDGAEAT